MSDYAPRYQWKSDYPILIKRCLLIALPVCLLWFLLDGEKISPIYICKEWSPILMLCGLYLFSLFSAWLCWSWGDRYLLDGLKTAQWPVADVKVFRKIKYRYGHSANWVIYMRLVALAFAFLLGVIATGVLIQWIYQHFDWTYLKQFSFLCYSSSSQS